MEILESLDYEKFTRPFNREPIESHIKVLQESIRKNPKVFQSTCIRVDSKFRIIDGQHRYLASVREEVPIYHTIDHSIKTDAQFIQSIIACSKDVRVWLGKNYADINRNLSEDHRFLYEISKEIDPFLSFSSVVHLCDIKRPYHRSKNSALREGTITISNKGEVREFLDWFKSFFSSLKIPSKVSKSLKNKWYIGALYNIYFNPVPMVNRFVIERRINTHWTNLGCPGSESAAKQFLEVMCKCKSAK